jgi:hypothetical protein
VQALKGRSCFHEHYEVARVQFRGMPEIGFDFLETPRSTVNGSYGHVDASFVRLKFLRPFKLFQSAIVITKAMISIKTFLRVDFAAPGWISSAFCRAIRANSRRRSVWSAPPQIQIEMSFAHQTVRTQEFWIAPNRLFEEADGLK